MQRGADRVEWRRLLSGGPRQRQREQRVLRLADATAVRPIRALLVRMRVGKRRAARERLGRRLRRDRDRGRPEPRWLACRTGRVLCRGAGRTAAWIAVATVAIDTTDAGATRGGRRVAGRVHCEHDLRAQPATASWRPVRAWFVWLYRGGAKRGRAVKTG